MTKQQLLAATGNIWIARCYRDGNRRRFQQFCYVRAVDVIRAEESAKRESGCKVVDVKPWDPRTESVFGRMIVSSESQ